MWTKVDSQGQLKLHASKRCREGDEEQPEHDLESPEEQVETDNLGKTAEEETRNKRSVAICQVPKQSE